MESILEVEENVLIATDGGRNPETMRSATTFCRAIRWIATTNSYSQTPLRLFSSNAAAVKSNESSDDEFEGRTPPSEKVQELAENIAAFSLLEVNDLKTAWEWG